MDDSPAADFHSLFPIGRIIQQCVDVDVSPGAAELRVAEPLIVEASDGASL